MSSIRPRNRVIPSRLLQILLDMLHTKHLKIPLHIAVPKQLLQQFILRQPVGSPLILNRLPLSQAMISQFHNQAGMELCLQVLL